MKKILALIALLCSISVAAQQMRVQYGPWVTNVTEDSFTVIWTTETSCLSWVEVAPDNGNTWYQSDYPSYFETVAGRKMYGKFHSVNVKGLQKATSYRYRIVGKAIADDSDPYAISYGPLKADRGQHRIKTLDTKASVCRFSMVNDIHFDTGLYFDLINGMDKQNTDFIVLNGDITSYADKLDTLVRYTIEPIKQFAASYPVVFSRGNHEGRGSEWYLTGKAFPTSTGEFYYTFRQGPVAVVVLDAGEDKPDSDPEYSDQAAYDQYRHDELEWLKQAVKDPAFADAPQKICIMHIPAFDGPEAWYSQHWISQNFTPVLNAAGVKLMLSGHEHNYMLAKPGKYGNDFTIIANSADERLDFEATADKITVKTVDCTGKQTRCMTF